jgi:DNA (cytosine-5)-methyltransferase 1
MTTLNHLPRLTSIEICSGGGGQALGLEQAGFSHLALVDNDRHSCQTLRANRPGWEIHEADLREFDGRSYRGVDLLSGGVPCPPFSIAGRQLGSEDGRDLFPEALRLAAEMQPRAIMLENVRGLADKRFETYRTQLVEQLEQLGYRAGWRLVRAAEFGVPQLRPRFLLVALFPEYAARFQWPTPVGCAVTVGAALRDLMEQGGWLGAREWALKANRIAPTVVGGSKKHGGPDLGPQRARRQWAALSVDGGAIADEPPGCDFPIDGKPRLTVRMVARIQGFPDAWEFAGGRTQAYRQVGNAFPPPVAGAVGRSIAQAICGSSGDVPVMMGLEKLPLLEMMARNGVAS